MNVKAIVEGLYSLSGLTRMHFALYDDKQQLVASSPTMTSCCPSLRPNAILQDPYNTFLDRQLKLAVIRVDPLLFKGLPVNTMPSFPLHYEGTTMTAVVEAFVYIGDWFQEILLKQSRACIECHSKDEEIGFKDDSHIYSSEEITSVFWDTPSLFFKPWSHSEFDNGRLNNIPAGKNDY